MPNSIVFSSNGQSTGSALTIDGVDIQYVTSFTIQCDANTGFVPVVHVTAFVPDDTENDTPKFSKDRTHVLKREFFCMGRVKVEADVTEVSNDD